jgi:hypothetical protein
MSQADIEALQELAEYQRRYMEVQARDIRDLMVERDELQLQVRALQGYIRDIADYVGSVLNATG